MKKIKQENEELKTLILRIYAGLSSVKSLAERKGTDPQLQGELAGLYEGLKMQLPK